jgi:hypothetical protein
MKKPMLFSRASGWTILAFSGVVLGVALAAPSLGIDSDQKWGPIRVGLLLVGAVGVLLSLSWKAVIALESADAGGGRSD